MNQETHNNYDEISLRELIQTLLNQKFLIATITIASILVAFVVSFFIMSPVYEAKTVLMASQIIDKVSAAQRGEGIEGLLDSISDYPQLTIETYKEQIKNPVILQETIKELKLDEQEITRTNLRNMITLETVQGTNLIAINVKNSDKALATQIANTISVKFTDFISNMVKQQASKSSTYISQQLEVEKEKLDETLLEYKSFLSQPKGVKELDMEINSKIQLLTTYKTTLSEEKINEQNLRAQVRQAQEELKSMPDKIELKKSLSDEAYMTQIANENTNGTSSELFDVSITTEEKNDSYFELKTIASGFKIELAKSLSQQDNIIKEIESTQGELEVLQADLADKSHQESIITRRVNIAQSTYDAFTKKLEESRIAQSSAVGDSSIIVVSPAVEPLNPVSPNKTLNLAIAAVLGLMIGVFIAFFREYWKNSAGEKIVRSK